MIKKIAAYLINQRKTLMKKQTFTLLTFLLLNSYIIEAADPQTDNFEASINADEIYYLRWACVPLSKCTYIYEKMTCVFAQTHCLSFSIEIQEKIKNQRIKNRLDPNYVLPPIREKDTKITPKKTALFKRLYKNTDTQ